MSPRALVTGGAGLIGSNLCWELAARGWQVVALDDFSAGTFENLRGFPGDVVAADFGDVSYWARRVGKINAVFHQAAISDTTVMDQRLMMRVNVEAFRDLLAWAAKSKVKRSCMPRRRNLRRRSGPATRGRRTSTDERVRFLKVHHGDRCRPSEGHQGRGSALLQRVRPARGA